MELVVSGKLSKPAVIFIAIVKNTKGTTMTPPMQGRLQDLPLRKLTQNVLMND